MKPALSTTSLPVRLTALGAALLTAVASPAASYASGGADRIGISAQDNIRVLNPGAQPSATPQLPWFMRGSQTPVRTKAEMKQMAMNVSMRFIENRGQVHDLDGSKRSDVKYYGYSNDAELYFTKSGIGYAFFAEPWPSQKRYNMEMELIGSNKDVKIHAEDQADGVYNYLKGSKDQWIMGVGAYNKLVYENVYNNIDMVVQTHAQGLKYDFVVRPGGNVKDIKFTYNGATNIGVKEEGVLKVETPVGYVTEQAPYTYQGDNEVSNAYRIEGNQVSFDVGDYDHSKTLVIDPLAAWSTYFGSSNADEFFDVEITSDGSFVAVGWSESTTITSTGVASRNGRVGTADRDGIIARFNPNGSLAWWSFLGGNTTDEIYSVELEGTGALYVMGKTNSNANSTVGGGNGFPASAAGVPQSTYAGSGDAFVACLDGSLGASGGTLRWASYKGGVSAEEGMRLSVRTISGVRYLAGTGSTSSNFPVSPSPTTTPAACSGAVSTSVPAQPAALGSRDAYVFLWQETVTAGVPSGATENWATYLGGISNDEGTAIEIAGDGGIYIGGWTESVEKSGANPNGFPTGNASITVKIPAGPGGTAEDGYIGKMNLSGCLLCLGYIGGSGNERVADGAMGLDDAGRERFMVVGTTFSNSFSGVENLPASGCGQKTRAGAADAFITILTNDCLIACSTYHGGINDDFCTDIDVLENSAALGGRTTILVCGNTESPGTGSGRMPISPGDNQEGSTATPLGTYGAANNGARDMWVACFNMSCCRLWSTFWGGSQNDFAEGVTASRIGEEDRVIVAGYTSSYTPSGGGNVAYPVQASGTYASAFQQTAMPATDAPDGALLGITFVRDEKLSIDLTSFGLAAVGNSAIRLNWRTASEDNNQGFVIERAILDNPYAAPDFKTVASYVNADGLIGLGTSPYGKSYGYTDGNDLQVGKYHVYRLVDVSYDGVRTVHPSMSLKLEGGAVVPVYTYNAEVLPNPATEGFINLQLSLPQDETVTVEIYSADGKKIATPVASQLVPMGDNVIPHISVEGFAPGVYTAVISTGSNASVRTRQFVVVR